MAEPIAERVYHNEGNTPLLALLPSGPGRALDLGCGDGANARRLAEQGWKVTGVTLSPGERDQAARWCETVHLADLQAPLPEAIPRSSYELVLMSHVLEHLLHPERALASARQALGAGGVLAVALPNVLFYHNRFAFLMGRFEYTRDGIMDETHLRFYTFGSGARLLTSHGFEVTAARASGGVPLGPLRSLLPGPWARRLDRAAVARWPGLFGAQSLYLARPDPTTADPCLACGISWAALR